MAHARTDIARPVAWPPPADQDSIAAAVEYGRLRDPVGHNVHTALAVAYLFLLPLATTPKDAAAGVLLLWALVRLPHTWSCYTALARDGLLWLLAVWAAWHGLGLLWSPEAGAGWDELQAFRVLVTPLVLWPILDRREWLVGALLAGVFAQNLVQLGQGLEIFGLGPELNDRLGGLVHPIQTGAFCAAAMCWHLGALLGQHHVARRRILLTVASVTGLVAATGGLVFSGSRGPWISAAIAVPLGLVVTALRRPPARRPALVLAASGLVCLAGAWLVAGDIVSTRVEQAVAEVRAAASGDYETDVGERLTRWSAAWAVFLDKPIAGAGGGGYAHARVGGLSRQAHRGRRWGRLRPRPRGAGLRHGPDERSPRPLALPARAGHGRRAGGAPAGSHYRADISSSGESPRRSSLCGRNAVRLGRLAHRRPVRLLSTRR
jgi:hypothetical protein